MALLGLFPVFDIIFSDPASGGSSNSQPNMTDFANIAMRLGEACAVSILPVHKYVF